MATVVRLSVLQYLLTPIALLISCSPDSADRLHATSSASIDLLFRGDVSTLASRFYFNQFSDHERAKSQKFVVESLEFYFEQFGHITEIGDPDSPTDAFVADISGADPSLLVAESGPSFVVDAVTYPVVFSKLGEGVISLKIMTGTDVLWSIGFGLSTKHEHAKTLMASLAEALLKNSDTYSVPDAIAEEFGDQILLIDDE